MDNNPPQLKLVVRGGVGAFSRSALRCCQTVLRVRVQVQVNRELVMRINLDTSVKVKVILKALERNDNGVRQRADADALESVDLFVALLAQVRVVALKQLPRDGAVEALQEGRFVVQVNLLRVRGEGGRVPGLCKTALCARSGAGSPCR
jgi:hypothetical protein